MQKGTLTPLLGMAARGAAASLRPAEEIAREMVPESDNKGDGVWRSYVQDQHDYVPLERQGDRALARAIVGYARALIARTITIAREEGAAAERSRPAVRRRSGRHDATPRDLAGRIRALVQAKAGEWADEPDMERAKARMDILRILRLTLAHAKSCDLVDYGYVEDLRSRVSSWRSYADVSASATQAADKLEAIVRECAPTEET